MCVCLEAVKTVSLSSLFSPTPLPVDMSKPPLSTECGISARSAARHSPESQNVSSFANHVTGGSEPSDSHDTCTPRVTFPLPVVDTPAQMPRLMPPKDPAAESAVVDLTPYRPSSAAAAIGLLALDGRTIASYGDASALAAVHDVLIVRKRDVFHDTICFVLSISAESCDAVLRVWRPDKAIDAIFAGLFGTLKSSLGILSPVFGEAVWIRVRHAFDSPQCMRQLLVCEGVHTDERCYEVRSGGYMRSPSLITCRVPPPEGPGRVKYSSHLKAFLCAACTERGNVALVVGERAADKQKSLSVTGHGVYDVDNIATLNIASDSDGAYEQDTQIVTCTSQVSQFHTTSPQSGLDMFVDDDSGAEIFEDSIVPSANRQSALSVTVTENDRTLHSCDLESVNSCDGSIVTLETGDEFPSEMNAAFVVSAVDGES